MIPFSKELEHINAYTAIECERFKDKLSVVYDIRTVNFLIPPLTVEPFVENAIKHGIRKRAQKGVVTIRTEMKENYYLISIIDDGVGFDPSVLQEKYGESGIGDRERILSLERTHWSACEYSKHAGLRMYRLYYCSESIK